jgi:PAS domain S-box-containing protein
MEHENAGKGLEMYDFLKGGGEMGGLTRSFDWQNTPLGSPDKWPGSLRTTLGIVLHSAFPMFLFWGEDLICFYNDAFRPSLGQDGKHPAVGKKGENVWREIWDFIGPLISQVMTTGEPVWFEDQLVPFYRNGRMEDIYWTFSYSPAYGEEGRVSGVVVTCTETTDKVQTRKSLEQSEERFRAMAENSDVLIFVADEHNNATYLNKAWVRLTGKPIEQLIRLDWADLIHPGDRDRIIAIYFDALRNKTGFAWEFRIQNKNGGYAWLFAQGSALFRADGSFAGHISSCTDITAQKQVEEEIRQAQKKVEENERNIRNTILRAPIAICIFRGPHYIVEIANDRMLELWGATAAAVLHKPIFEGLPEVKDQGFEDLLSGVYHTGKAVSIQEYPVQLPRNGRLQQEYVSFLYEAEIGAGDAITGILAVALIVTDQVRARRQIEDLITERTKELADANRNLERSNAELSQFAYIASHDLQEPIRKVNTYAQLLEDFLGETIKEQAKNYLAKITNAGDRMLLLIRDVLAYSELSKSAPVPEPVHLQQTIRDVRAEFELLIEHKGARFEVGQLPAIPAMPLQMSQLFGNLISNALKYSRAGTTPVLTITSQVEGDYHHILVADNGIGFDPQYAEQIFSIFQRLHRKTEYSGTGIGLAICKKIVQNHAGQIYATSQPGEGSTFHILLPVS